MSFPIVDLAFWETGLPAERAIDALLADPATPLARHGLTGIATAYAREHDVGLHAVHEQWGSELALRSLAVDGALTEVLPALEASGVPCFLAKGPAIAYKHYRDPRLRPYTDLDVYVPRPALGEARATLAALGYAAVSQARGPLGGLGRELQGGRFGAVVEVHDHPVDNLLRRYLPPIEAFLEHTLRQRICGTDVPILSASAHLALQAIHLGAGHRYQKLILHRDLSCSLDGVDPLVVAELGAAPYVASAVGVFAPERLGPYRRGVCDRSLSASLRRADPIQWDEHAPTLRNLLAVVNQCSAWRAGETAAAIARSLAIRTAGQRVPLRLSRRAVRSPLHPLQPRRTSGAS